MPNLFPSISSLIPNLKAGDDEAWTALTNRFRPGLLAKTRLLLKKSGIQHEVSADDLVQETILKGWQQHLKFQAMNTDQFAKWILTILRNTWLDHCRSASRRNDESLWMEVSEEYESPSARLITMEQEAELHACIAELDSSLRDIIVFRNFEGLKFREISDRLGMNINTVVSIYKRGLVKLTAMLQSRSPHSKILGSKNLSPGPSDRLPELSGS